MARYPTVTTPKGGIAAVAPEHPSTKLARHTAVVRKMHGAARSTNVKPGMSKAQRANYDAVTKPRQSAANAKLNAEMLAGGVEPRVSVTPAQAAALKASGSRTY
jgi:hypothetical protein